MKVKYIHLQPSEKSIRKAIAEQTTRKLRRAPYLLFHFDDGSTSSFTIPGTDLHRDPEGSLYVALKTLEEAKYLHRQNILVLDQYFPDRFRVDLKTYLEKYLAIRKKEVQVKSLSQATVDLYRYTFDVFSEYIGAVKLDQITRDDIERFKTDLLNQKSKRGLQNYSRGTVNSFLRVMSAAFSYAQKAGLIKKNPVAYSKQYKIKKRPKWFDRETDNLIKGYLATQADWKLDIYLIGLHTGARISEIHNARATQIRKRKYGGVNGYSIEIFNKGDIRTIVVDDPIAIDIIEKRLNLLISPARIKDHLYSRPTHHVKLHLKRAGEKYLFFEVNSLRTIQAMMADARKALRLDKDITFHSLRHTFAVRYLEENRGSIYQLKNLLGHGSVTTTEIYLSVMPDYWD